MTQSIAFLRGREADELSATARSTRYLRIQQGLHPPPVPTGPRAKRYIKHEVEAVVEAWAAGATPDQVRALVARLVAERGAAA